MGYARDQCSKAESNLSKDILADSEPPISGSVYREGG